MEAQSGNINGRIIATLDVETTGLDVDNDRIVQIAIKRRVITDGLYSSTWRIVLDDMPLIPPNALSQLINPQDRQIAPEAAQVHGITRDMLSDKPTFADIAADVAEMLRGTILCGYNIRNFDLPMLAAEFARTNVDCPFDTRSPIFDSFNLYAAQYPRTLAGACKTYLGQEMPEDAHDALVDVQITEKVLCKQLERITAGSERRTVDQVIELQTGGVETLDFSTRIIREKGGDWTFNFGKYKGEVIDTNNKKHAIYLNWINASDFPQMLKDAIDSKIWEAGRLKF